MIDNLWTWGGRYFGVRDSNDLWTHTGFHVGRFRGEEVFGRDGRYLGEVRNGNRLITSQPKKNFRGYSFAPHAPRAGKSAFGNYESYTIHVGYEEFPAPDRF